MAGADIFVGTHVNKIDKKGRVSYRQRGTTAVPIPSLNEHFDHHETPTAIGIVGRIFMDKNKSDPRLSTGCDLLLKDRPKWDGNAVDFYHWYWSSLALFQYDGPSGPKWRAWNEPIKNALVKNQNVGTKDCRRGSWEPVGRWCAEGGRVYATAMNGLTLQIYYRYASSHAAKR